MTLVELLIVIAIIVTVSAAILPSIKESLRDQKIKQASRQLVGMLESCKAEALASGRLVGIALERLNSESLEGISTSIQVVRLEELPPYTGDFQECGAYLGATAISAVDSVYTSAYVNVRDAAGLRSLVSPGDSISFGDGSYRFLITGTVTVDWTAPGATISEPHHRIDFRNFISLPPFPPSTNPYFPMLPANSANTNCKVPFKIYRKPVRNELTVLQLPKGVCVDLSCSGFGLSLGSSGTSGIEFSAKHLSGQATPNLRDYGPVSILFSPTGQVCQVTSGATDLTRSEVPINDVYLLLGKSDRVSPVNELEPYDVSGNKNEQANALVGNLMTSESLWIKINRANGRVSSASVDGIGIMGGALTQRLSESRLTAATGVSAGGR
jgi:type II secretory pathway pseudopilin PulG